MQAVMRCILFREALVLQRLELAHIIMHTRDFLWSTEEGSARSQTWGFRGGPPGTSLCWIRWVNRTMCLSAQVFLLDLYRSDQHEPHGYLILRPIGCRRYIPIVADKMFQRGWSGLS
jgi:hypothetical protein